MKDKLRLISLIKEFIESLNKYLVDFPHREIELKNKIKTAAYDLLELTYLANESGNINRRLEYQEQTVAKIKLLDFYINECNKKSLISEKKYMHFGKSLEQIVILTYSWKRQTSQTATTVRQQQ